MGAHGTLDEALANVASFASASHSSRSSTDKHPGSKHKSHKKHKKSKDKAKDKKGTHKKRKRSKHSSTDDSSDDETQHVDLETQLAKGREAVRIARRILAEYSEMRGDLREVAASEQSAARCQSTRVSTNKRFCFCSC